MLFVFSRTRWRSSFFCHLLLFVTFSLAPYYLITSTWEFDSACTYLRTYVVCLWSVNVGKSRQKSVPTHSKPCRQYWHVGAKFGDISPCRRHVADMSPTLPAKRFCFFQKIRPTPLPLWHGVPLNTQKLIWWLKLLLQ